ncbi:hypothetical protein [Jiangella mangrovi]|uniref:LPXTG cell wall anchor domain-containing protein n=1 Tax=Jiangella mangrovi TaxID=1524084 RepID=A0A7W9GP94_9ACTN|nr:hypothetical protein [Jiangella mangrovi]MBB5787314.1 hypothetical protein [Jiangella mangrovi]
MTSTTPARIRAVATCAVTTALLALTLPAGPAQALGLTCRWTGAGADANWSTAPNWTDCGGGAPGDGDGVVFGSGATQKDAVNDLGGTTFSILRVEESGYELSGDDIEVNFFNVSAPTTLGTNLELPTGAGEHLHHVAADFTIAAPYQLRLDQAANATDLIQLTDGATLQTRVGGGPEALRFRGTGTVELRGSTYAGTIGLEDDVTLRCGGDDCGGAGGAVTVVEDASLEFTGDTEFQRAITLGDGGVLDSYSLVTGPHAVTLAEPVTIGAWVRVQGGTGGDPLEFAGDLHLTDDILEVDGAATVPPFATLTSDPNGELRVGTSETPGSFAIEEGQLGHEGLTSASGPESLLVVNDTVALGPEGSGITTVSNGATLGTTDTITLDEDLRLGDGAAIATLAPGASLTVTDLQLETGGGRAETRVTPSVIDLVSVEGIDGLELASAGIDAPIIFSEGGSSTYAGDTVAESGAVALRRDTSVTGDFEIRDAHVTTIHTDHADLHDLIPDTAEVSITGSGAFVLNDNEAIGALSGTDAAGSVLLVDAASGLDVTGSATTAFAGDLRGGGTLTHSGDGSLGLGGDWTQNADGSRLAVAAGTVAVDGDLGQTGATVQGTLRGTGTVGTLTLDGGTVAAGASAGCLTVNGEFTGDGTLGVELGGHEPCDTFDRIATDHQTLGDVTWDVAVLDGFHPAEGDEFAVVTTTGPGSTDLATQEVTSGEYVFDAVWDGTDVLLRVTSAPDQPTPSPTDEPTGSPTDGPGGDDSGDESGDDSGSGDDDPAGDDDQLPDTGVWATGGIVLAALLLAGGLFALRARRRALA